MEQQKKLHQIQSAIIMSIILLGGLGLFFWRAGFFNSENIKRPICDSDHLYLCDNEKGCVSNNFYWYDGICHKEIKSDNELNSSKYSDFNSLQSLKKTTIINNFVSYTPNSFQDDEFTKFGFILKNGKISKGYIEFIISKNEKPLTTWESLYFKVLYNTKEHYKYGGHIIRSKTLPVPDESNKTHLFYALNYIPFISSLPYSDQTNFYNFNLFEIINNNKEVGFITFISSLDPAKIDEINIFYECDKEANGGQCDITTK